MERQLEHGKNEEQKKYWKTLLQGCRRAVWTGLGREQKQADSKSLEHTSDEFDGKLQEGEVKFALSLSKWKHRVK